VPALETHLANVAGNRRLFLKAYLIEFYASSESAPDDVFTFSLPPESEEIKYGQRKTETKTFGGLHVDEYGMDAASITLSGSTVNQSLKMIFGGTKPDKWLSGEEEMYYFRDLLQRYRSIDSLQKPARGKIMVYDLSKYATGSESGGSGAYNRIESYWRAFPGELKISRSKERPFAYKYTWEFTGVCMRDAREFRSRAEPPPPDLVRLDVIDRRMDALLAAKDLADGAAARANEVNQEIAKVSELLRTLGNVTAYCAGVATGIVVSAGEAGASVIDGAARAVSGAAAVAGLPLALAEAALSIGVNLQNATGRLHAAIMEFVGALRSSMDGSSYAEAWDRAEMAIFSMESAANELVAAAKSSAVPEAGAGANRVTLSYGHASVALKSSDTFESLAAEHLGDPERAIDIAAFNGAASVDDLPVGAAVKIPTSGRSASLSDNRVYARRGDRDNYGRDILLDENGMIAATASGDYALVGGPRNLAQAVLLRLRESAARRLRLVAYGLRSGVADPTAGTAYVLASIDLTVLGDPRVRSVDAMRFAGKGDFLNVEVEYSDVNGSDGAAAGRV